MTNIEKQLADLTARVERLEGTSKDYSHLLPDGYEFCNEEQAEKWVKVECPDWNNPQSPLGIVLPYAEVINFSSKVKSLYRPIRKKQTTDLFTIEKHGDGWAIYKGRDTMHHGANLGQIHDEKLAQYIGNMLKGFNDFDPYQPDWSQAPEGTVAHAYDGDGLGYWYMISINWLIWFEGSIKSSYTLPANLDWKQSLRINPNLK